MKIAIYVSELDVKGGTHKQVLRLAEYLVASGHTIEVITPIFDAVNTYPEFKSFKILTYMRPLRPGLISAAIRRMRSIGLAFKMTRSEIVNLHDNRCILFFTTAWLLRKGKGFVWQINDLHPAFRVGAHKHGLPPSLRSRWQRTLNYWMAQKVDTITVNVGKNAERVSLLFKRAAILLHCGVDFPHKPFAPLAIDKSEFKILSTGVFFPYRNYESLVLACSIAQKKISTGLRLTIVGDTRYDKSYADYIVALASQNGVSIDVRENLSQDALDKLTENHHIFAFLNIDQSWGLAVFEAAARFKPIILSKSVGASELLAGQPGFFIVDPQSVDEIASTIERLFNERELYARASLDVQLVVKDMSWRTMYCAPVEKLFQDIIAQKSVQ